MSIALITAIYFRFASPTSQFVPRWLTRPLAFGGIVAFVLHGILSFTTWNDYFDAKGQATKFYYIDDQNRPHFFAVQRANPWNGEPLTPVTAKDVSEIEARRREPFHEVLNPKEDEWFWFGNPRPRLWYSRRSDGIHLFNAPGFDGASGAALQPVTTELREVYYSEHRKQTIQIIPSPVSSPTASPSVNIIDSISTLSNETRRNPITMPNVEDLKQVDSTHKYDLPGGGYFEGKFVNGKASGRGSYTLPDGNRYEGPILEGVAEGFGTTFNKDGSRYDGRFHAGLPIGTGTLIFKDGTRFVGTMVHTISNVEKKLGSGVAIHTVEKGTKSEGLYTLTTGMTFEGFIFRDDDNINLSLRGTIQKMANQSPSTRIEVDGHGSFEKQELRGSGTIKFISAQLTAESNIEMVMSMSGTSFSGYFLCKNPDGSRYRWEVRDGVTDKYGTYTFPDGKHSEQRKIEQQTF